ncbi:MAG: TraR/DksA C4-type zinc finger protein [Candidatus Pacebacteria bacterium]|nr:TraR/DksA C4-type zinc finger protein [Candidatus Paceibacterota bacterium]
MNTEYKNKLEEEKVTLTKELSAIARFNSDTNLWEASPESSDTSDADSNNNADRFEDYEEKTATLKPLQERLDQVEKALAKIETGSYGECVVCGNEIEAERLNANPAAETCIAHLEA